MILLVTAPCAAAPAISSNPTSSFDQYKSAGDQARREKHWQDALDAYGHALELRPDPLVMGRAGLILERFERYDVAARLLERASTDVSTDIDTHERRIFFDGFHRVLEQVCRVDIHIDQANARIEIDEHQVVNERADFHVFLNPGFHTISAQKSGFHEAVQTVVTDRACKRNVALIMQSIPIEQLSLDKYLKVVTQNSSTTVDVRESQPNKGPLSGAKPPPNPYEPSSKRWFVGGAGVWIPFYATPGMGLGFLGHGGARLISNFEMGLEIRAAVHVLTFDVNDELNSGTAYLWGLGLTLCGRMFDRFFFCAIPQMTAGGRLGSDLRPWLRLGFGGRLGLEFHHTNRIHVRIFGEFATLSSPLSKGSNDEGFTRDNNLTLPSLGTAITFF